MSEDDADAAAIEFLINNALKDLTHDGHPVYSVPVSSKSSEVVINGNSYENGIITDEDYSLIQKLMEDKKMNKRTLARLHPNIAKNMKLFYRHCDVRSHNFVFRKCHPMHHYQCSHCKQFPPRSSSQFWSSLPLKQSGGLFFDCVPDVKHPGHYMSLLDMLKTLNREFSDAQKNRIFSMEKVIFFKM